MIKKIDLKKLASISLAALLILLMSFAIGFKVSAEEVNNEPTNNINEFFNKLLSSLGSNPDDEDGGSDNADGLDNAETGDNSEQTPPVETTPEPKKEEVRLVIYRNGDTSKPYNTIAYESQPHGSTLDVTAIDINKYVEGDFEFAGWFNDGGWNDYMAGKNPSPIKSIKVNGWTNLKCMITDNQRVIVKSVTNGIVDETPIYSGKATHGTNLLEYLNSNVNVPEKSGYTADKWYKADDYNTGRNKFSSSDVVNGWINVYVVYTSNSFTVIFDAAGGTVSPASKTVALDSTYGELPTPKKEGYTFKGWKLGEVTITSDTQVKTAKDHILVAEWEKIVVPVSKVTVADIASVVYNGSEHKPTPKVTVDGKALKAGTDFEYSYKNNVNAGTATVVITGKGSYSNIKAEKTFTIEKKSFYNTNTGKLNDNIKVVHDIPAYGYIYTGKDITAKTLYLTDIINGRDIISKNDYTVKYSNNVKVGTATITIKSTDSGNYSGEIKLRFQILTPVYIPPVSQVKPTVSVEIPRNGLIYNGKKQTPDVTVKYGKTVLKEDKDYTLTYKNNTNAGTATVKVSFIGNYRGTASQTVEFTIKKATLTVAFVDEKIMLGEKPALDFTVKGFVNGETPRTAAGYIAPEVTLTVPKRVGKFILYAEGGKAKNYTFDYIKGYVTVVENRNDTIPMYCATAGFTDLDINADYHEAVDYVVENGYFKGVSDTKFDPYGTLNRAMLVTVLGRVAGVADMGAVYCGFDDVKAENFAWAMSFISWGRANGIVKGMSDTEFAPAQNTTVEQAVTFIYRFAEYMDIDVNVYTKRNYDFSEYDISDYALDAMTWAYANGIIGEDELENAGEDASRILFVSMVYEVAQNMLWN